MIVDAAYIRFGGASGDPADLGGKAGALERLRDAGLPVPESFTLLPHAMRASLTAEQAAAFEEAESAEAIEAAMASVAIDARVAAALQDAVARLCPDGERVAVRSSASDEDGAEHSFAGQLDSFLFVEATDVGDRVARVWRSGFSPR
ncbi:MAG: PEP/pyruvate-binding domain-containing protein, partial [Planctomycetota bacterium]